MEAFAQAWQCIQAVIAHQKPLAGLRTRSPVSCAHHLHVSTVGLSKDGFTLKGGISEGFFPLIFPLEFFFCLAKNVCFFWLANSFFKPKKTHIAKTHKKYGVSLVSH
jgi:hypothetical protein